MLPDEDIGRLLWPGRAHYSFGLSRSLANVIYLSRCVLTYNEPVMLL